MKPSFIHRSSSFCKLLLGLVLLSFTCSIQATTLPSGFVESWVAGGMLKPTTMAFAPDGRVFICEQEGQLRIIKNGTLLATPFLTVDVDFTAERGLVGVAIDPNFASNEYVYIYYTAKTPTIHNRIVRYTANGDVALAGSAQVILDLDTLGSSAIHNGGAMHFGRDGKMYVAVGENAVPSHAQTLANLLGKVLRINKDGTIPADNPFYNTATGKNRAIYALGFRNPFNFDIQSTTGRIFVNDVGASAWEEINDVTAGKNYGWPTTEGPTSDSRFQTPHFAYPHGDGNTSGCAVTGGAFYNGPTPVFPSQYVGKYFFTDYCNGWIRVLDPGTRVASGFATGLPPYPVDLKVGADGALYYISHGHGAVYKISYTTQAPPTITQQPANQTVSLGQPATFTISASGSPTLTYQWQRNGANIAGANSSSYTIASVTDGDNGAQFRCIVTNAYGSAISSSATLTTTSNRAPSASITSPAPGSLYNGGQTISYSGTGSDPEDGTLSASAFTWRVDFHHDEHVHPFLASASGSSSGTFTIPARGETSANVWYRIYLTVRDAQGLTTTVTRDVLPRTVQITLRTSPAGLQVNLDGQPQSTPVTVTGVVGVIRTLEAFPQVFAGKSYAFQSWSDGGAVTHEIATPATNTTYTATYEEGSDAAAPQVTIVSPVQGEQLDTFVGVNGTVSETGGSGLERVDLVLVRTADDKRWDGITWVDIETGVLATVAGSNWSVTTEELPSRANLLPGDYDLKAVAYDNAGNVGVSTVVTVTIVAADDITAPTVAITTPSNNATSANLGSSSGTVNETGGSGLERVDLVILRQSDNKRWDGSQWVDFDIGVLANTATAGAWSVPAGSLPTGANLPPEKYTLKAVAFDNAGNVGVSPLVVVTIAPATTPVLSALSLNPTSVAGGNTSVGTVTMSSAVSSATTVALSTTNTSKATVPASVTIAAGASSATFPVSTSERTTTSDVTITATLAGVAKSAPLILTPTPSPPPSTTPVLSALSLNPTTITGGSTSVGTVTMSSAVSSATTVALSTTNTSKATVPANVTIAAGASSVTFSVSTSARTTTSDVTITATLAGVAKSAPLFLTPTPSPPPSTTPVLSTISLNPSSVTGGSSSIGTVTMSKAVTSATTVTLSVTNTSKATVPASVTIAAGASSATFTISTSARTSSSDVTITATLAGVAKSARLILMLTPSQS